MTESRKSRAAVVIPGGQYGPHVPLLMYAGDAAQARGAQVYPISWTAPEQPMQVPPDDRPDWVAAQVTPVLDELTAQAPGAVPLLIGKSFGTYAAAVAADQGLPAIWLTRCSPTSRWWRHCAGAPRRPC